MQVSLVETRKEKSGSKDISLIVFKNLHSSNICTFWIHESFLCIMGRDPAVKLAGRQKARFPILQKLGENRKYFSSRKITEAVTIGSITSRC